MATATWSDGASNSFASASIPLTSSIKQLFTGLHLSTRVRHRRIFWLRFGMPLHFAISHPAKFIFHASLFCLLETMIATMLIENYGCDVNPKDLNGAFPPFSSPSAHKR
jgi:hypothetical protein